ncbi:glycine oxidase ThiO [Rubrivirga marina]|uniref:Glycine oxidase ThiO n=1 Tax=Rubrivirga marina TaxID=1196024 RepID=A0A271J5F6_9BACT|nr:glycine oxidase ThiO [Rubrivirga marina]
MPSPEVVVVGGGIAGLGVAWELAARGRRVVVLERDRLGRGTSWAAAGMLAPSAELGFEELDLYALGRESLARWRAFARRLEAASGAEVGYREEGTLVVADDRDSLHALRRLFRFQEEHGAPVEWLSGEEAVDLEPLLSPRLPGAVFSPEDHQVDHRAVVAALAVAARRAGAELREGTAVVHIGPDVEAPTVRLGDGTEVVARVVVLAAGAWSPSIGGLDPAPPVRGVKGQALALRLDPERGLDLGHVVRGPDAYLVPKADGRLIVGATSEEGVTDRRVTAGGVYRLLEGAVEIVPGVEEMELVETWAAHRPASRDHAPLLGRSPHPGVVYATGHYRHGVLLAPVTAEEVAAEVDRLLDGAAETAPVLAPFSPLRFPD